MIQTKYQFNDESMISCGTNHSAAISSQKKVIVWGYGAYLGCKRPDADETQVGATFKKDV